MHAMTTAIAPVATESVNVASRLSAMARVMPDAVAAAQARRNSSGTSYTSVSFEWLDADSSAIAAGLQDIGVEPGMRIALLVRPGIEFVSLVFALLKAGAVQILIDPGMGKRNLIRSLSEARPQGMIGGPVVQALRSILYGRFPECRLNVTVGRSPRGLTLDQVRQRGAQRSGFQIADTNLNSPAAVIFTSGSTGAAKGVLYRHGNFDRQVTEIRDFYGIKPGEIDVACFPLFGLFNAAMGVTTVFPAMDFSHPARVDPSNIVSAVNDWQASQAFGSPAVWNRVGRYCEERSIRLPSLTRVLAAGAPVSAEVQRRMAACIHPEGAMHTPYGATEALPVASISSTEVLSETAKATEQGSGVCVGTRFGGIEWRVIRIHDGPMSTLADAEELPRCQIGELIVRGPVVTTEYVTRVEANAMAKIYDTSTNPLGAPFGRPQPPKRDFWHRMGDLGYLDGHDRFWFCGRMSQRVTVDSGDTSQKQTLFTIPCEAIFNGHPDTFRSALVAIGRPGSRRPAIVVEPLPGRMPRGRNGRKQMIDELRELGQAAEHTKAIEEILICKSLPVDVRHNVKINREQLSAWATRKLR
jgi:acyl-CoA synthetase (AMP-forming)/AMP-acid ligase II